MKGIVNLVIGSQVYMYFAANMMVSLKLHNDYPIQLITQKHLLNYIPDYCHLYDDITFIDPKDIYEDDKIAAGKAKVNIYKYLKYDESVYLDVDGLCIRELSDLFDNEQDYILQHDKLHWADDKHIIEHFKLKKDDKLFGSNSSYQFIRKGKLCEKIFSEAAKAIEDPLPLNKQSNNWFNMQPDELYLAIGMCRAGVDYNPYRKHKYPIYFKPRSSYTNIIPIQEIVKNHYVMGCYGSDRYNAKSIGKLYDKLNQKNWYKALNEMPIFKYHGLMTTKHRGR